MQNSQTFFKESLRPIFWKALLVLVALISILVPVASAQSDQQINASIDSLNELGQSNYDDSNFQKALSKFDLAIKRSNNTNYIHGRSYALNSKGLIHWKKADLKLAMAFVNQALEGAISVNDSGMIAVAHNSLALIYADLEKFDLAQQSHEISCLIFRKLGRDTLLALAELNYGIETRKKGYYEIATQNLQNAEDYFELNDTTSWLSALQALGNLYREINKLEGALEYHKKVLEIRTLQKDTVGMAKSYLNLGYVLVFKEDYEEAMKKYRLCYDIRKNRNDTSGLASIVDNIGEVDLLEGRFEEAIKHFQEAKDLAIRSNWSSKIRVIETELAQAFLGLNELDSARYYWEKNKGQILKSGRFKSIVQLYEIGRKLNKQEGDLERALLFGDSIGAFKDSLLNQEKVRAIEDFRIVYEVKKKDDKLLRQEAEMGLDKAKIKARDERYYTLLAGALIVLSLLGLGYREKMKSNKKLTDSNQELEQANEEIADQKQYIELLNTDLKHRVKNDFHMAGILISTQLRTSNDTNVQVALKILKGRVESMGKRYNGIYMNHSGKFAVNAQEYLTPKFSEIKTTFDVPGRALELDLQIKPLDLTIEQAVHLDMILNELVTNAYKYIVEVVEKPEIRVALSQIANGDYVLEVADNGPGKDELAPKEGNGTGIIEDIVSMLGASVETENSNGLTIRIEFTPAKEEQIFDPTLS